MRKKIIRVFYFENNNLGDFLSKWLIEKLSCEEVKFKTPPAMRIFFKRIMLLIYYVLFNRKEVKYITRDMSFPFKKVIIGIGSLLEHSTPRCICWGTGMGHPSIMPRGGDFIMTRGYLSKHVLQCNGYKVKVDTCGDPALLMPLIYKPKLNLDAEKQCVGIIGNMINLNLLQSQLKTSPRIKIINMLTTDVEKNICEIVSCNYIYSSSLHGIILSHAYRIPCVWFQSDQRVDDYFRFLDYFSSVGIKFYRPLTLEDVKNGKRIGSRYEMISTERLYVIQRELLKNAPFNIKYFNQNN